MLSWIGLWTFATSVNASKTSRPICPARDLFVVVSHFIHFSSSNEAPVFNAAFPSSARCFRRAPKTWNARICVQTYSSPIKNVNIVKSNQNSLYFRLILIWAKRFFKFLMKTSLLCLHIALFSALHLTLILRVSLSPHKIACKRRWE